LRNEGSIVTAFSHSGERNIALDSETVILEILRFLQFFPTDEILEAPAIST
jgi:hypothetical protein